MELEKYGLIVRMLFFFFCLAGCPSSDLQELVLSLKVNYSSGSICCWKILCDDVKILKDDHTVSLCETEASSVVLSFTLKLLICSLNSDTFPAFMTVYLMLG